jgi:hypothetical protein
MGKITVLNTKELLTGQSLQSPAPAREFSKAFPISISFFLAYKATSLNPVSKIREKE